ncbi:MAG: cobyrinate a,c-diamide synthase [Methanoregula sp.]
MIPCIVIAGTHSGCGKTTIASGIMEALTARGMTVQPFKVGPDFIDPSHHTRICRRPSRNLDPFMMGEDGVTDTFNRACSGADIAVIEGVMGLFDGVDGSDQASTAHVASLLSAPVILVVHARGMSRSIHALINGFCTFDPSVHISGVIVNAVGSERHRQMIESSGRVPAFGWIPRREDIAINSRHLGLFMAHEQEAGHRTGEVIEEFCDVDAIIEAARTAPDVHHATQPVSLPPAKVTIGIAMDPAFCFYYEDNFDRLRSCGARLVFFSPLNDPLPDTDALYLGGGYPELHLDALSTSPCTRQLEHAAEAGLPVYGECGGLMYLAREIAADTSYRMCGILPASAEMTGKIQGLGYVSGQSVKNSTFLPASMDIRGHEFHYSKVIPDCDAEFAFRLSRGKGIENGQDGLIAGNTIGSYTHAYFSDAFAQSFVHAAEQYKNRK